MLHQIQGEFARRMLCLEATSKRPHERSLLLRKRKPVPRQILVEIGRKCERAKGFRQHEVPMVQKAWPLFIEIRKYTRSASAIGEGQFVMYKVARTGLGSKEFVCMIEKHCFEICLAEAPRSGAGLLAEDRGGERNGAYQ